MFGYVRPLKSELKVREYELFKTAYCGLCNTLKKRCGYAARFLLNYDFTFLAMLLSAGETACDFEYRRCLASPVKKKCACVANPEFELCAYYSVVLFYWKLRDSLADGGFFERVKARVLLILLGRAYRKAVKAVPEFDGKVRACLRELFELEKSGSNSIDETSDKFANILAAASETRKSEADKRALSLLLYHLGRQIYILDAVDDLGDDSRRGAFNAVAARFGVKDGKLADEDKGELKITLEHSAAMVSSAFELLSRSIWTPILTNIIYLGIPWVTAKVLEGTWRKPRVHEDK